MLWLLAALLALVLLYAFWLRPHVKAALPSFFAWVEPIESALWAKSRTILVARLVWVGGLLSAGLNAIGAIDWNAVATELVSFLPAQYQHLGILVLVPLAISAFGGIFEWLRRVTAPAPAAKD